jgi:hypothetical protein
MGNIQRAFNKVREDLWELGLLADGRYLDRVDLVISPLPIFLAGGAGGFVFDQGVPLLSRLVGFGEGTIYIPRAMEKRPQLLRGVIRHEFAHAWAWLDKRFIRGAWFRAAFGRPYFSEHATPEEVDDFKASPHFATHASDYALTRPREDFAETFELFIKHRKSLAKFRSRPGLFRKLQAVEAAVKRKNRELKASSR